LSVTALALAQQQTSNSATDISAIAVDRKGCFGACPKYTLTLRRQGTSTYIGKTGPRRGLYTAGPVGVGDFDQLMKAISDVLLFDLPDVIGLVAEDAEEVVVTVTTAEKSKTVTTYDLASAPAPFAAIVMLADTVAARLSWERLNQPKDGITPPFPLRKTEPLYTEEARKARLQGSVILQVEVRPDGTVAPDNNAIIRGLGMGLNEKAIQAVNQWIFKPAYRDGKPMGLAIPVAVQVEFRP
jgi:TonB family protein